MPKLKIHVKDEKWKEFLSPLLPFIPINCMLEEHYPKEGDEFNAFNFCPFNKLKVVILGQDPYFNPNVAGGLAFSSKEKKVPHSLSIIFKAIERNCGITPDKNPDLKRWAEQGVLLLNTALTVKPLSPGSHTKEWEVFTDRLIAKLGIMDLTWLLWGNHAKAFAPLIKTGVVLKDIHPAARQGKFEGYFNLVKEISWK